MPLSAAGLIARHGLRPHPEGGHYREVYRSRRSVGTPEGYQGPRVALTAIYFLLKRGEFSAFHRVRGEEVWVHLEGGPLELVVLGNEPQLRKLSPAGEGGVPVSVVPAGAIQAARPLGDWALATCIVAPGFEFADFEMPDRDELLRLHPEQEAVIRTFGRHGT